MFSFHRRPPGPLWLGQSHHYQLLPVKLQVYTTKELLLFDGTLLIDDITPYITEGWY